MGSAAPALSDPRRDALARATQLARPVSLAETQLLPVLPVLASLLPEAGLRRGCTLVTMGPGATSLALGLIAAASAAGSWVAAIGLPDLGLAAAAEAGVALERLAQVTLPRPAGAGSAGPGTGSGDLVLRVLGTLVDAIDLLLVGPLSGIRAVEGRRLQARLRERGGVLVGVGSAPVGVEPDITLTTGTSTGTVCWQGIDHGSGRLAARRLDVHANGRRAAARPRHTSLWLPGPSGQCQPATGETTGDVVPLHRPG